ncbi:hypothetical protein [Alkalihalobacillus deserti]|uniref:hypothetical protein n=1 Tax=Alkalihalobacillus deserti TaxID=2879466 RepID=UPI001D158CE5|nr:hypothetical protein [Alkalihalobacillus deserti]
MESIRSGSIWVLVITFLIHTFFAFPYGERILGFLTLIVVLLLLSKLNGFSKAISSSMLLIGIIVMISSGNVENWEESVIVNLPLIVLLVIVPMLSFPIGIGKYDEHIGFFIKRYSSSPRKLFLSITGLFFLIGPIINMGTIRLMDDLLKKLKLPNEFLAKSYMRGFTVTIMWSPFFASLLLVLHLVNVPLYSYLPVALVVALIHLLVSNLLFLRDSKHIEWTSEEKPSINLRKIYELLIIFFLFFLIVFLLDFIFELKMVINVTIGAFILTLLWSLYLKSLKPFLTRLNTYRKNSVYQSANEIVLFLTAGFFGSVISKTTLGEWINSAIVLLGNISILLLIFSIIIFTSLLAMVGIHQIVTISAIATSVVVFDVGIHPVAFALTLMCAWTTATIISPISAVNVILSNLLDKVYRDVAIRWNGTFTWVIIMVYTLSIYITNFVLNWL